ncbi:MAG: sulfite exporter TauE/SafE family protein [Betaproteobacteria bacterium]
MALPLITDPFFYLVAIPSVLLMGVSKSGFGTGFGSLAVPLMALAVSVPEAAAILMPVLLLTDILGLIFLRSHLDWTLLRFLVPCGLVGTVLGFVLFRLLSPGVVEAVVGISTLIFLAQRLMFPPKPDAAPPPRWVGAILTATSGFTSFIAHAGGPPISAYVIPLRLSPLLFTSTMAYFFFVINLSKWIPYGFLGLLDLRNMLTSLTLLPLVPLGVWVGVNLARRIDAGLFYKFVYVGMFLTGLKLLWDGLRSMGSAA